MYFNASFQSVSSQSYLNYFRFNIAEMSRILKQFWTTMDDIEMELDRFDLRLIFINIGALNFNRSTYSHRPE